MKIAILGAGRIGGTLGQKWAAAGHEIFFGVRDPQQKRGALNYETGTAEVRIESLDTATAHGEVVVLAVPGSAAAAVVNDLGGSMGEKIVIDATNRMTAPKMHALDIIRATAPAARTFRAFNSLGWENFAQPVLQGVQADLFYCGDESTDAQLAVERLISDIGLRPVRVGGLEQADVLDGLTRLWFALIRQKGRHLAFKMLEGSGV